MQIGNERCSIAIDKMDRAYDILNEIFTIRNNIIAERSIRDKAHLSRSSVMHILAGLKEGDMN
ncbi:hypothetical protein GNG26_06825 [Leclercia sp. J807]|uniref:helix-turn-helix domain-containing protein n=1 Tax=Leclercia sp. J807 TaxID=2681307 RepID=UPI0012E1D72E|nr:helix-turn-helix domain-containing protein [Leclercia sp. J807]QGU10077.1 hypothetical protein GNG26_06825 [Leclercia sp. J807]